MPPAFSCGAAGPGRERAAPFPHRRRAFGRPSGRRAARGPARALRSRSGARRHWRPRNGRAGHAEPVSDGGAFGDGHRRDPPPRAEPAPPHPPDRRRRHRARPDALITIDSPDFCLRVARKARASLPDLRVIHYVAPSVWAWRPGRAAKMARHVDHVLALLPFEPPYMQAAGMTCDFVGHPVAARPVATPDEIAAIRADLGIGADQRLMLALPGSRRGEVSRHAPVFAEVIRRLRAGAPDLAVVVPAAGAVADLTRSLLPPDADGWPRVLDPTGADPALADARKRAIFAAADAALAASGTVSLELAAAGTPMVIAYAANPLSALSRETPRADRHRHAGQSRHRHADDPRVPAGKLHARPDHARPARASGRSGHRRRAACRRIAHDGPSRARRGPARSSRRPVGSGPSRRRKTIRLTGRGAWFPRG